MTRLLAVSLAIFLLGSGPARAALEDEPSPRTESAPLWEIGLGGGAAYTPDYPGSDHAHLIGIPFPWGLYRGEILHSDRRGGTRARFFQSANFELNLSAAGGFPSSSGDDVRQGLPDLEWLMEVGPRLTVEVVTFASGSFLRFGLPLRAALSSNGRHLIDRGFVLAPELLFDDPHFFGSRFDAYALLTVNFAEARFGNYFYGVRAAEETPTRPSFAAKPGYFSTDLNLGVMLPLPLKQVRLYTFMTLQSLSGAANARSPLMRANFDASYSAVLIWTFAQSSTVVRTED